jgi:hypothetical protein
MNYLFFFFCLQILNSIYVLEILLHVFREHAHTFKEPSYCGLNQ